MAWRGVLIDYIRYMTSTGIKRSSWLKKLGKEQKGGEVVKNYLMEHSIRQKKLEI